MGENKKHIANLNEYLKTAETRANYSIERYDILIISLSSGGIALVAGFFDKFKDIDKSDVYFASLFFSIAIIINLLSQVTGYFANSNDIKYCNEEIKELEGKNYNLNYLKYDCFKKIFNFLTTLFNGISLLSFIAGAIFLLIFIKNLKS
jgi:cytochrome b subunit of formate dehydrogenase